MPWRFVKTNMPEKLKQGFEPLPEPKKETEPTLSLEELDKIFRDRPELIEEIKKVFSVSLRHAFTADYGGRSLQQWRRIDPYEERITEDARILFRTFEEMVKPPPFLSLEAERWQSDREMILKDTSGKQHLAEAMLRVKEATPKTQASTWISFVFSVNDETAKRYYHEGQALGTFAAPRDIKFHGAYIGTPRKEKRVLLSEAAQRGQFNDVAINRATIEEFIQILDQPRAECQGALAEIDRLGRELGIEQETIKTLKATVREFATYVKPEPTTNEQCFREIMRCFTVPHTFRHFAREWHDLQIETDFYEHSVGGHPTFFHQVNVLNGKMVVDWTARQYRQFDKEPYPFIYRVGDQRFKSWGPLRLLELNNERIQCDRV